MTTSSKSRVPQAAKNRCYWMPFSKQVRANGGTNADAEALWGWLLNKRAEVNAGLRAEYFTWNFLLQVVEGDPSVELSQQGRWQILCDTVESITRMP